MKNRVLFSCAAPCLAFSLAIDLSGTVLAAAPAPEGTEAQIPALLDAQARAWNVGDLEAFCAVYADDALFVTPAGLTRGRQAVLERYRAKYPDAAARGNLSFDFVEVRRLGDSGASAVARWKLSYPSKPAAEGLTLLVFERRGAGWRILQDASM